MHSSEQPQPQNSQWPAVMENLLSMVRMLETSDSHPVNLQKFAEGYGALSRAYLAAIEAEGRTSMRAEAVVKALDLHTAKSCLQSFLRPVSEKAAP